MKHSHESSTQELSEQRLNGPSSDASKQMVNSQPLVEKVSKIVAISTPGVTFADHPPSSQASLVDGDSPMPSSYDDSHSEDSLPSSPVVSSQSNSISPKRKTCSDTSDQEESSPKRSRTRVKRVTREHHSTTDILTRLHAIYPILKEYTDQMKKKKDVVIEHETGSTLSLDMSGAYNVPDMDRVWKFCEDYEDWYSKRGRSEQYNQAGWCFTDTS
ncbi:hypothetical protein FANTH_5927 [Fusarium anthophilum]|uniref:Uncharacterized protein n=1 Tax=Fusarium anthophilum TaxID=48485 RepID=A0A8H4ZKG6_9HYPO|nr:hypothetical protein FANTH_5927 [Fusarium anthophilum]